MLHTTYGMQVQDAVTDAGQPLTPPPIAPPAASEQAAGGGTQFRSFKTPSATDLVDIRGSSAPGPDGGSSTNASGGTAPFPIPGPAPPFEAPPTPGAAVTATSAASELAAPAASAPDAGWATFGDPQPEFATAPSAPAAGGAAMSKAFGSFEQFAQVFACTCSLMCSPLACPQANCSPWHMKIKSYRKAVC
jgi:hypothetical protein